MHKYKSYIGLFVLMMVVLLSCISQFSFETYIPERWQYRNLPLWIQMPILGMALVMVASAVWEVWSNFNPHNGKKSPRELP
jgi:hypothetical protein